MKMVIYHGGCRDGFCAAWVAYNHGWQDAEFYLATHGEEPPDVAGKDVVMLDFTYRTREIMDELAIDAKSLLVLDHHKTAEETLRGAYYAIFDMERSGAGLAWDFLSIPLKPGPVNPAERIAVAALVHPPPRPWLVDYVEDRDLWRWTMPRSKAVNAYISTLPYDFEAWDRAADMGLSQVTDYGAVAQAKTDHYVAEVGKHARYVTFEGRCATVVNAPYVDISEVLHNLLLDEMCDIAVGWFQRGDDSYNYSLRSNTVDVSQIAQKYGGGGHKNAAGFQTTERLL